MAYTYNPPTDGAFDAISEVRYIVGDRRPGVTAFSLSDAEIAFELQRVNGNRQAAAAAVAQVMGDSFSSESATSKSAGGLSISRDYADTAKRYYLKARSLRRGTRVSAGFYTGTHSAPQFSLGMHDYTAIPATNSYDAGDGVNTVDDEAWVTVIIGDEARPAAKIVMWVDQREYPVEKPTYMGESDIWYAPTP